MKKKRHVKIELETTASHEDIMQAVILLQPESGVSIDIESVDEPDNNAPPAQALRRDPMRTDPRAVWDGNKFNQTRTLANCGLTLQQLLSMQTKRGTLEYSLKRSILKTEGITLSHNTGQPVRTNGSGASV